MRKIGLIFKREYLQEVRTKWFIVFAVLPFVGAGILGGIVTLKNRGAFSDLFKKERIAVIDNSVVLMDRLEENKSYQFVLADETQDLNDEVLEGNFAGYLIIDKDVLTNGTMTYYTKSLGDIDEIRKIERTLNAAIFEERLSKSTIDPEELMRIRSYIKYEFKGSKFVYISIAYGFSAGRMHCNYI